MANKLDLDSTIKVNDITYNVNAVKAEAVANKLKVYKTTFDGSTSSSPIVQFDGNEEKSIEIVPVSGGKFQGPIRVPGAADKNIDGLSNTDSDGSFLEDAVLNYKDLVNVVLNNVKNNAIVYNWDGSTITGSVDDAINSISIVEGKEELVDTFARYNNDRYIDKKSYLSTYLYISSPYNKVFYGVCTKRSAELLAINTANIAAEANKLVRSRTIRTNLSKTEAKGFNGTEDIEPGVTGVLPILHGGTGAETAAKACTNIIKNQNIEPGTIVINTPGNTSADTYKHKRYGRFGIDLKNSDIIGMNALFFADSAESISEGINFVHTLNKSDERETTYDRIYAKSGKLYFDPKKTLYDDPAPCEVYHSGGATIPVTKGGTGKTSLSDVTVGKANTIKINYYGPNSDPNSDSAATKWSNITICSKGPASNSVGADGDIWIKY